MRGTCVGFLNKRKAKDVTAARRTSSDVSETAMCKSLRTASLFDVPAYARARV